MDRRSIRYMPEEWRIHWLSGLPGRRTPFCAPRRVHSLGCLVLGDDAFAERHRQTQDAEALREVSKAHRRSVALPLDDYRLRRPNKDAAMAQAYRSGAYTMAEIGQFLTCTT